MPENKYWFARRFPVGTARNSMAPVSPEGFAVVKTFVRWMIGGALAAAAFVILGFFSWWWFILAPIVFVGCAIYGAWYFISQAQGRGDHQHTVDDYKAGRVQGV